MGIPIWRLHQQAGDIENTPKKKSEAPRIFPRGGQTRNNMPVLRKDNHREKKLLMHIGIAPQGGNRNMIIRPKLRRNDTTDGKLTKILLTTNGNMPGLRPHPKKYTYRYQPIIQTTSRERICRQGPKRQQKDEQQEQHQQETKTRQGNKMNTISSNRTTERGQIDGETTIRNTSKASRTPEDEGNMPTRNRYTDK